MPENTINMNMCKVATGKDLCRGPFFKKIAGWNPACNVLKPFMGTYVSVPEILAQIHTFP